MGDEVRSSNNCIELVGEAHLAAGVGCPGFGLLQVPYGMPLISKNLWGKR